MKTLILFVLCCTSLCAQKIAFSPILRACYDGELQLGTAYHHQQMFWLVAGTGASYFAAEQNYLNDTRQYTSKGVDMRAISDYFKERVLQKGWCFYTFLTDTDFRIKYSENRTFTWVLYADTKVINGVTCQMAATNKFGRRWIAYFSKDYPVSTGPYKFYGLPGLIFEIYDTKEDYHFVLTKLEKTTTPFGFDLTPFKTYDKKTYLKAVANLYSIGKFPPMGAEQEQIYAGSNAKVENHV